MSTQITCITHTLTIDTIPYHILYETPISTSSITSNNTNDAINNPNPNPKNPKLIILIHALMSNLHMWDSTVKTLHSKGYSTLRFDHVGHGQTLPPTSETKKIHFDDITRHIHTIHTTLFPGGIDPVAIIGCSIGGVLSLRYAQLYPDSKCKYISIAPPGGLRALKEAKSLWEERVDLFRRNGVRELAMRTVERWFPEPCEPEIRDRALEMNCTTTLRGYEVLAGAVMDYDYEMDLELIKWKVLVVVGGNDLSIGSIDRIEEDVVKKINGARFVNMQGVGHLPPLHDQEGFERIMLEFLEE